VIFRLRADRFVEAGDGFNVVIENFRFFIEHGLKRIPIAAEIGDEHFDAGAGGLAAHFANGVSPDFCAAIFKLITIHAGDHHVLEIHQPHRIADAIGLIQIK